MKFLLHSPFWTWTLSIAQATLEFSILQLQLPQELMIRIENMVPNWSSAHLLKEDAFPLSVYYEVHFCPYLCVIVGLLRTPYFLFLLIKPHIFIHINFCSLFFSFLNITPYVNLPLTSGLCSAQGLIPHYWMSIPLSQLHWEAFGPQNSISELLCIPQWLTQV